MRRFQLYRAKGLPSGNGCEFTFWNFTFWDCSESQSNRGIPSAWRFVFLLLTTSMLLLPETTCGQDGTKPWPWIDPQGIPGAAILVGGGAMPAGVREAMLRVSGNESAKLIVIPTADQSSDSASDTTDPKQLETWLRPWQEAGFPDVQVLNIPESQPSEAQLALLEQATAIWFEGGQQRRVASRIIGTAWQDAIGRFRERGGVIGGTSAGAAIQSLVMIASGLETPDLETGLDIIPGAIVDQHFSQRSRQARLRSAVAAHPDRFGLGIDEGTAVLVQGRSMVITGEGTVTVVLAPGADREPTEKVYKAGDPIDLIALRRAARARATGSITQRPLSKPQVPRGTLVIVGGGGLPPEALRAFLMAAGGGQARIVVLPTAEPPRPNESPAEEAARDGIAELFRQAGAAEVTVLTQRTRDAVSSPEFLEAVDRATAIWFGGGRQWRFVDAYEGTSAESAFARVLERGGVIGGSSAGATIQGDYLARGNPLGNLDIMAEGYERGFAFLPGVAIDQHFSERGRLPDLLDLVRQEPEFLGIGIDETTALIVTGSQAEVVGRGSVTFVRSSESEEPLVTTVSAGDAYDLLSGYQP